MLSNHNQRGPSLIHHNDENASITTNMKQLSNNSNATTPASKPGTSKRRAFGDISNKKSSASANGGSKSSNANNLVIKKSNVFTPARSLKLQTLQSSNQQQIKPLGTKITASSSVVPKSSSKQVILPRKNATKTVLFEPVDDVELPAGRLFSQEPQDDDGDLTQLSEDEFHRTMWDDWRSSMDQKYKEAEAANDAHTDLQVQERMNSVFQNDQGTPSKQPEEIFSDKDR